MRRSTARRAALLTALVALVLAACQGQSVALLEDPNDILAAAATNAAAATSVRAEVAVEGSIAADPFGAGSGGVPLDLRDTKLTADLDLRTSNGRVAFSTPGFMGMNGDAIITAEGTYFKTSMTGPKYQFAPNDGMVPAPENPLKGLVDFIARRDLGPVKGADVPCAGGTCYTLAIQLTAEELAALGGGMGPGELAGLPLPDLANATVDLVVHVEHATARLSNINAKAALGALGDITVTATFTHWNEGFQIRVPPPELVERFG
jgi:hypothetical protein